MSKLVGGPHALRKKGARSPSAVAEESSSVISRRRKVLDALVGDDGERSKRSGRTVTVASVTEDAQEAESPDEDSSRRRKTRRRQIQMKGQEVIDLVDMEKDERLNDGHMGGDLSVAGTGKKEVGAVPEAEKVLFEFPPGLKGSIKVTNVEYDRLTPEKYLNDSIIDFYIKFIEMFVTPPALRDQCYFFSSFFFKRLTSSEDAQEINHGNVKRWTQEVNLFTKKYIFVPICSAFHWSLVVICNCGNMSWWKKDSDSSDQRPLMLVYDSLLKRAFTQRYAKALKAYLQQEFLSKKEEEFETTGVTEHVDFSRLTTWNPIVPGQKNEYDCGLYLLQYIVSFLQDPPQDFNGKHDLSRRSWFTESDIESLRMHLRLVIQEENKFLKTARNGTG